MYTLSTLPFSLPIETDYGPISSTEGHLRASKNYSHRAWKNGKQEKNNYPISWKDLPNARVRGKWNLPQACSENNSGINEMKYGLETPWYASLPGLNARFFIENYSDDQAWTRVLLYRLPDVKKDDYIQTAKLDYNKCQEQHQMEWHNLQKWHEDSNLEEFGISKKNILEAHFLAAASIFEAERSGERVAWVKSQILAQIISTYYSIKQSSHNNTTQLSKYGDGPQVINLGDIHSFKKVEKIVAVLFEALTEFKKVAQERNDGDVSDDLLHEAWGGWLKKLGEGVEEEGQEIELIVRAINICGGHILSKEVVSHHEYKTLSQLTNTICHRLLNHENQMEEVKKEMQLVVELVVQEPSTKGISKAIKQTFLEVAKTFCHRAYFSAHQIDKHIKMLLFEKVV